MGRSRYREASSQQRDLIVPYALDPTEQLRAEVIRVATECLDDALARLDVPGDIDADVHDVRKRCKEIRGLVRLVRPGIGKQADVVNRLVRDAARELSPLRDAHVVLQTFDHLRLEGQEQRPCSEQAELDMIRDRQMDVVEAARASPEADHGRFRQAHALLSEARSHVVSWDIDDDVDIVRDGLGRSYGRARRVMDHGVADDDQIHEWRKSIKYLWFEVRLLRHADPDVLDSLAESLSELSELLGDDHDLAVLVVRLHEDPKRFGGKKPVKRAVRLARDQQAVLRRTACELAGTLFVTDADAFAQRLSERWTAAFDEPMPDPMPEPMPVAESLERERTFLVADLGHLTASPSPGASMRQGYLAIDAGISVRIRAVERNGYTLTVKAGTGATRTELQWPIGSGDFEALWPLTQGRRVSKSRHRIRLGRHVVELDTFRGALAGLVLAEVEFASDDDMTAFDPPSWFGREVTDDPRYGNASLSEHGRPPADS